MIQDGSSQSQSTWQYVRFSLMAGSGSLCLLRNLKVYVRDGSNFLRAVIFFVLSSSFSIASIPRMHVSNFSCINPVHVHLQSCRVCDQTCSNFLSHLSSASVSKPSSPRRRNASRCMKVGIHLVSNEQILRAELSTYLVPPRRSLYHHLREG